MEMSKKTVIMEASIQISDVARALGSRNPSHTLKEMHAGCEEIIENESDPT